MAALLDREEAAEVTAEPVAPPAEIAAPETNSPADGPISE
jgi:hypothetical protein